MLSIEAELCSFQKFPRSNDSWNQRDSRDLRELSFCCNRGIAARPSRVQDLQEQECVCGREGTHHSLPTDESQTAASQGQGQTGSIFLVYDSFADITLSTFVMIK